LAPSLRALADDDLPEFIATTLAGYIDGRIGAGEAPEKARRIAQEQTAVLFPDGRPAPGQLVYRVIDDDGVAVGLLWIGPHGPDDPHHFWVWDVAIDENQRGRGLGRAAMLLAEEAARHHGATELGLNVFGPNTVARRLYESLDYETTAINMRKALG
jgi:ribosomal protein S18 acetylase RimI-like enzyme